MILDGSPGVRVVLALEEAKDNKWVIKHIKLKTKQKQDFYRIKQPQELEACHSEPMEESKEVLEQLLPSPKQWNLLAL